ncbi:MAG: class I SAM-dependent methyltransferase [Candidatus Omnitrophica bacterium]|nr:class I SAM-dependent methyltransferase [Candidatus Omnitrophota bacterium]
MRKGLDRYVDPFSGERLTLKSSEEKSGHVISGTLSSSKKVYPVISGIPRFVDKPFYEKLNVRNGETQTAGSFGNKWREKRFGELKSADISGLRQQMIAVLGCHSESGMRKVFKKVRRTLNAGCGVAWSEQYVNYCPETERHCFDVSLSVEAAYKATKGLGNVIIAQASIFEIPYPDNFFDIVYSIGVVHHTPDPERAFYCLADKVKPGGILGIYIYNVKPFMREILDENLRKLTTKMSYGECMKYSRDLAKLGKALRKIKKPLMIHDDLSSLGIKKGEYSVHGFIYDHIVKCWYNDANGEEYSALINQDWYHPTYASHHTKKEIEGWFKKARMKKILFIQPKGWEYSGYFVSGRKE